MRRVQRLPGTRSKYGAVKVTLDGMTFHSKREAARYGELKLLEKAGEIQLLHLQRRLPLLAWTVLVSGTEHVEIGSYVADFSYCEHQGTPHLWCVIEDVKGFKTPLYRWKKKHVAAQYGIEIRET